MDLILIGAGLIALLLGGGWLVSGAVGVARHFGLSPLVIGVTLVGMGTSLPELLTSLRAAWQGASGIALGNVVGSNVANIALILGLAALIRPVAFQRGDLRRDGLVLMAITVGAAIWVWFDQGLSRIGGLLFLSVFAGWMIWQLRSGGAPEVEDSPAMPMARAVPFVALGLVALVAGAEMLVRGAIGLAEGFGVSEAVIGLTIVAVGTSLPELATSLVAAWKGRSEVALGNVLGSNVFNLLAILGATGAILPLTAPGRILSVDLWVMAAVTAALLIFALPGRLGRPAGALLLVGYAGYMATLV
ncbi:calcium/sodium antiporter [Jannaschia aquimarina]|uniref:YrbG_3 protein n=2 Tax=Jannaschia aquimarina TaxID=935700 RepID=A0A0D1D949_9RHOB|nr:calcium/sodium antiporter [Jannaschia aquimarina]KIT16428.1 Inner membrane protein YrbG [Jannaschia aquimarina]SNS92068.1 cation:H+ antiporter [Jannaschia aquimarina]